MNRHALVITAYQELDFLIELCEIYSKYFKVYVHVDTKSKSVKKAITDLNKIENVIAVSTYKINWGSCYHIYAFLDLIRMACDDNNDYIHVLSANTVLAKNPTKITAFFEQYPNDIFMEIKQDDGTSFKEFGYRYYGYFFQHIYNVRGRFRFIIGPLESFAARTQAKIKLRRNVTFKWKGYVYCHLPKRAASFLLNYIANNPSYLRKIKYCYVGEEFFFQNIFMSSEWKSRVHNNTLIYDIWSSERGYPAELNINDYDEIKNSQCYFCRKVSKNNRELWDRICHDEMI